MMKTNTVCIQSGPESDVVVLKNPTHLRGPVTFKALHKWPESESEFLRGLKSVETSGSLCHKRFLMRQKYLRSYKFSREEEKSFIKKSIKSLIRKKESSIRGIQHCRKAVSERVFRILLHCVSRIDVHDDGDFEDSPGSSTSPFLV